MKRRKHLYIRAKRTQNSSDWTAYKQLRNKINSLMSKAHENYCKHLFDDSYCGSRKRFWSLIKNLKKDFSGIVSIDVDGMCLTTPTEKAEALNRQFYTFLLKKTVMSLPLNLTLFLILMNYTFLPLVFLIF